MKLKAVSQKVLVYAGVICIGSSPLSMALSTALGSPLLALISPIVLILIGGVLLLEAEDRSS